MYQKICCLLQFSHFGCLFWKEMVFFAWFWSLLRHIFTSFPLMSQQIRPVASIIGEKCPKALQGKKTCLHLHQKTKIKNYDNENNASNPDGSCQVWRKRKSKEVRQGSKEIFRSHSKILHRYQSSVSTVRRKHEKEEWCMLKTIIGLSHLEYRVML